MGHAEREIGSVYWSDSLTLGLPRIDREHKEFLTLCAALELAIAEDRDVIGATRRLCHHSIEHFASEERQLRAAGYAVAHAAVFHAHADEHLRLTDAIAEACARLVEEPDAAIAIALDIKAALLEHMLRWDLRYKEYMVRAGRDAAPHPPA